ncbi:MAG: NTP transferase domain-containing protein [Kordiimonadaceae bacterium]|nr:NTP transferase domain-containing protein [Kordiimonadaceae bacterium]MBO6570662.1 NTP transferase domain-containing protein [Kordiimonadaceae bacterium]MBO6966480.1 NTP transferase domain-containing protein [Kordiimonadaceae bacterium]
MGSKTVAIIGARLSSSRLPGKQLLELAGRPLIAHIVTRLREISAISEIIVATTNEAVNKPLVAWAQRAGVTAFDWAGDQNDVVGRVDAAFKASGADRFVYVCGDCPFIEPKTIENLIEASKEVGQDGIALLQPNENGAPFIHEGFDVFNGVFWDQMVAVAHEPFEREHVGAVYFHLNKVEPSEVKWVDENPVYAEINHRLSVDTPQDYAFAQSLYDQWYESHDKSEIVDLRWVISKLQSEPELIAMNAHVHQKAVKETAISVSVLCEAGPRVGMGHLSRACVIATSLQAHLGAAVTIYIRGQQVDFADLANLPHQWMPSFDELSLNHDCLVCDVKEIDSSLNRLLLLNKGQAFRVAVDQVPVQEMNIDLLWSPSVVLPGETDQGSLPFDVQFGADCFLLRSLLPTRSAEPNISKRLIVLTGGSDPLGLAKTLPAKLEQKIDPSIEITWVQGPYAQAPVSRNSSRFKTVLSPPNLHQFVAEFDAALCVYGVTFFECLQASVPVVAFDPIGAATANEWEMLKEWAPELIADSEENAIEMLTNIFVSATPLEMPMFAQKLVDGPRNFAAAVKKGVAAVKEASDAAA